MRVGSTSFPYAFLALKWSAFGWNSTLWQWTRFVQMIVIAVGAYWTLRNFTPDRIAASLGAGLFVCAATATTAWIRLTMAEPLALMFLLGAIALACRFQSSAEPKSVGIGIALLMVGVILTKELIAAATFPFVLLLAWSRAPDGSIDRIRLSPRNRTLLGACVTVMLPASLAVAAVALLAPSRSYTSSYGSSPLTIEAFLVRFTAFIIPAWPGRQPAALTTPVNVCYLSLVIFGWYLRMREREQLANTLRLLGLLLLLPALGALVYLPWPAFADFYGLPVLITPAIMLVVALDAIAGRLYHARYLGYGAATFVLLSTALQSEHVTRAVTARDEIDLALLERISRFPSVDTIYVGSPPRYRADWRLGYRIARSREVYTNAGGVHQPPIKDVDCDELHGRERRNTGNLLFVSYSQVCGSIDHPTVTLIRRFSYLDPPDLSVRPDSVRVDLLAPQHPQDNGKSTQAGSLWSPGFK
jgi:hypothetical protein